MTDSMESWNYYDTHRRTNEEKRFPVSFRPKSQSAILLQPMNTRAKYSVMTKVLVCLKSFGVGVRQEAPLPPKAQARDAEEMTSSLLPTLSINPTGRWKANLTMSINQSCVLRAFKVYIMALMSPSLYTRLKKLLISLHL